VKRRKLWTKAKEQQQDALTHPCAQARWPNCSTGHLTKTAGWWLTTQRM